MVKIEKHNKIAGLRPWHWLVLITILGAALRLYLVFTAQGINSDAHRYALTAQKMANEGLLAGMRGDFLWPFFPVNRNLILYPFLGRLLLPLTGDAILSLRLVSALAGIALIPLIFFVTDRLFHRKDISLVAALLVAFHHEFARASASVFREVIMAFLVTLALYLAIRTFQDNNRWSYVWGALCGLILFLSFITRVEGIAAAAGCGALVLFMGQPLKWRRRIVICGLMAVVFLSFEIPWVMWMRHESGYWLLNQWQITKKADVGKCVERHFDVGDDDESVE
jgi:4-amino-4-deoxy-L-arabinose transferase-like glycosyltransferase